MNTPFDQRFYLILSLAVGGTNGYFPDGEGGKPWIDRGLNPMGDFWRAAGQWLPTWPEERERGMTVRRVRMWEQGKCGEAGRGI